jgi:LysM repeat protein
MPGRSALCRLALLCAAVASAGLPRLGAQAELADLREDLRGLTQRVNELSLRVEQLEHENADLKASVSSLSRGSDSVTTAQLNTAIAELNAAIKASASSSRTEILQQVAAQMEALAKQTNAVLDSLAKAENAGPAKPAGPVPAAKAALGAPSSTAGVTYVVQKGDTVESIAKKTGGRFADIVNANKLADPSKIQVGQRLFIPQVQ